MMCRWKSNSAATTSYWPCRTGSVRRTTFSWLGASDPVHFDYVGPGAVGDKSLGVLAFQRLWNRNNPTDRISTSFQYFKAEVRSSGDPGAFSGRCAAARRGGCRGDR